MEVLGKIVLYLIMACCAIGAVATVVKEDSGLAQSFHCLLYTSGPALAASRRRFRGNRGGFKKCVWPLFREPGY